MISKRKQYRTLCWYVEGGGAKCLWALKKRGGIKGGDWSALYALEKEAFKS